MVSIVIPVYQISGFIERCIRSVMAQTYTDIECVIVDDGSGDDSIVKCEHLIEEYKGPVRFKILHHSENRGLSAARNTGTDTARGEYVYYLDGDDEITPDCIEKLVLIAQEHPEAEMIQGNSVMIPNDRRFRVHVDRRMPNYLSSNGEIVRYYHKHWIPTSAWNKLIKRSFMKENDLAFKEGLVYEDLHWMFFVMKHIENIRTCKDVTYHYYVRPDSIVKATDKDTLGKSYSMIYGDILNELTPGCEREELNCYVEGFCRCYLNYAKETPEFVNLYRQYHGLTKKYDCRLSRLKLSIVAMLDKMPFGLVLLQWMKDVKTALDS